YRNEIWNRERPYEWEHGAISQNGKDRKRKKAGKEERERQDTTGKIKPFDETKKRTMDKKKNITFSKTALTRRKVKWKKREKKGQ
ncbi:hypothetical protein M514_19613, partial [Trichuris suis]